MKRALYMARTLNLLPSSFKTARFVTLMCSFKTNSEPRYNGREEKMNGKKKQYGKRGLINGCSVLIASEHLAPTWANHGLGTICGQAQQAPSWSTSFSLHLDATRSRVDLLSDSARIHYSHLFLIDAMFVLHATGLNKNIQQEVFFLLFYSMNFWSQQKQLLLPRVPQKWHCVYRRGHKVG